MLEKVEMKMTPSAIQSGVKDKIIVATFPRERSPIFYKTVEFYGGTVYEFPLLKLSHAKDLSEFDRYIKKLNSFHLVIFSSPNMAKIFFERLQQVAVRPSILDRCYVLSIGAETTKVLKKSGVNVDASPRQFTSDQAVKLLRKIKKRWKVLIPCSDKSLWHKSNKFENKRFKVYRPVLYTNQVNHPEDPALVARVFERNFDCIVFTSPSGVVHLSQIYPSVPVSHLLSGKVVSSIGPTTTEACRRHGVIVNVEPQKHTIASLMWSTISHFDAEKRQYKTSETGERFMSPY